MLNLTEWRAKLSSSVKKSTCLPAVIPGTMCRFRLGAPPPVLMVRLPADPGAEPLTPPPDPGDRSQPLFHNPDVEPLPHPLLLVLQGQNPGPPSSPSRPQTSDWHPSPSHDDLSSAAYVHRRQAHLPQDCRKVYKDLLGDSCSVLASPAPSTNACSVGPLLPRPGSLAASSQAQSPRCPLHPESLHVTLVRGLLHHPLHSRPSSSFPSSHHPILCSGQSGGATAGLMQPQDEAEK